MSIHSEHPFLTPRELRGPARRLRGLLPSPVTIWTSADGERREGWTISSMLVADGEPAEVLALVDEDSDWWDMFRRTGQATINVLPQGQGWLADVFAQMAPSPGGPFRTGEWLDDAFGPRLAGAAAWAGVRLLDTDPDHAGWGLLVRAVIEWVEFPDDEPEALEHRRGRYR
ncbi:MAG: flavin reductase family protein [Propionibacteriaceae bacterium]|nr:flavin reductase family protein [Propionibacteriaceae bacterium]